jgi:phosphatidylserine/phosphatidylglycerophosphate/cardiolipin synthase-like enzyme
MEDLATLIAQAKQAVLFLAFLPGTPSVANWAALAQKDNPHLFVRGCVTSPTAAEGFYYQLVGGTPAAHPKGQHVLYKQDYKVIAAEAFDRKVPEGWQRELLNAGIAIIHDKIVVIDPFSDFPIVVTGSHNLGHKASFDNDENLLIIRGNKALARAYMTHVLDVYDHFSARYWFNHGRADSQGNLFLEEDPEIWLARYFDANAKPSNAQLNFWMQATAVPQ